MVPVDANAQCTSSCQGNNHAGTSRQATNVGNKAGSYGTQGSAGGVQGADGRMRDGHGPIWEGLAVGAEWIPKRGGGGGDNRLLNDIWMYNSIGMYGPGWGPLLPLCQSEWQIMARPGQELRTQGGPSSVMWADAYGNILAIRRVWERFGRTATTMVLPCRAILTTLGVDITTKSGRGWDIEPNIANQTGQYGAPAKVT